MSWTDLHVGDLVDAGEAEVKTGPFGTQLKASEYVEEGTPVINVRNIGFGEIRPEKLEFIAAETVQRLSSHLLQAGDIVFGRKGAVERHAFIQRGRSGWFQGSDCLRLRVVDERRALPRYLSYVFLGEQHKQWMIQQCSHGATMASLNQDIIRRIPLRLPPRPTQQRIAAILSAYDDLIENNTRRIAILEEMARRLYEEWFVHFRFPGHETAEFVEVDGQRLPKGWGVVGLYDVADVTYGHPFKSKLFNTEGEGLGVIRIRDVMADRASASTTEEGKPQHRVENGDILIGMDGSFYLGRWAGGEAWLNQRVARLRPKASMSRHLLFQTVADPIKRLEATIVGTTVAHLSAKDLKEMQVILPDEQGLRLAASHLEPTFDQILTLKRKNANLRAQRDLLLPKLVSGEIDVSNPEETAMEAAE